MSEASKTNVTTVNPGSQQPGNLLTIFDDHPFQSMRKEFDRLFNNFAVGFPRISVPVTNFDWAPTVEVQDKKTRIVVKADIPGVDPEDVEITLDDDHLVLKGEKSKETEEEDEEGHTVTERSYGSFHRVIPLAAEILPDKVTAKADHGVITVTLPKSRKAQVEETKARKIEIKSAS